MRHMQFIVVGDTHFCTHEIREHDKNESLMSDRPDSVRYADMIDSTVRPLFAQIRRLKPEFVISTGDFVEGGMPDDHEKTCTEMQQGWDLMKSLNCPCLIAKGTHEGCKGTVSAAAYSEIVLPEMHRIAGVESGSEYYCYEQAGVLLLFIDYHSYKLGNEQDLWLESQLKAKSITAEYIFIIAHPPLLNWGRHFFYDPEFSQRIKELCQKYPVDVYLCGHTHNQAVSWHEVEENCGYIQVMASSVGYPQMELIALEDCHALAEFTQQDHFIWGINEDSAPGFYQFEIDSHGIAIKWFSCRGDSASLLVAERRLKPVNINPPPYHVFTHSLSSGDIRQIKSASINIYGQYRNIADTELIFNGVSLGQLPANNSYAARCYLPLNNEALNTIGGENSLTIKPPADEDFVIGSIALEIILNDNRLIRSPVSREIFVCGESWKRFAIPANCVSLTHGDTINVKINLSLS
ncbi:MAG: metallophosphoesterase [Victivallaceae bacterium]|nr:metallophosphoesterase [Victivallaceae bacterium]